MNGNKEAIRKIYIRADGNDVIATGHIMRCLSIAEQLRIIGFQVIFVTADEAPRTLIERRAFPMDVLGTLWNDLDSETDIICEYARTNRAEVFIIDSYYVTANYLGRLSEYAKIIYIDDLYRFPYPVHTLINYSVFSDHHRYWELYHGNRREPKLLIGGGYAPLRDEFGKSFRRIKVTVGKVLITTGGTDRMNVAGRLLQAFMKNDDLALLEYHVIVGGFNKNVDMLNTLEKEYHKHIFLHKNVTNMAEWMKECDVAVSAAGSTLYELCSCGTPTICLEIADNQNGAIIWQKNGYMLYAGNAAVDMDSCIAKCVDSLKWFSDNYEERTDMSARMQKVVDGKGAMRIAQYIADIY